MRKYFSVRGDMPGTCPTSHPVLAGIGSNHSKSIYDKGSNDMITNEWMELQLASWIFSLHSAASSEKTERGWKLCSET